MKKLFLIALFILCLLSTKGQNYIGWAKKPLIENLLDNGLDTANIKESIIGNRNLITASFKDDSIHIEFNYFLDTKDEWNPCDSVVLNFFYCHCFNSTLETILQKERKKWKKVSDTVFVNIKKPGKTIYSDKSKSPIFLIEKLEIRENKVLNSKSIHIFHIWISEEEFLKYKQMENYR